MKYIILILFGFTLTSAFAFSNHAYGAFDNRGNYYCNPGNIELEKTIYKASVNRLNEEVDSYLSLNPSSTYAQLQDDVIHASSGTTEPTYDIMTKAQACLVSNGIDPQSIASPISFAKNSYAPEFGTLARLVVLVSIIGVIVISRRFYMKS